MAFQGRYYVPTNPVEANYGAAASALTGTTNALVDNRGNTLGMLANMLKLKQEKDLKESELATKLMGGGDIKDALDAAAKLTTIGNTAIESGTIPGAGTRLVDTGTNMANNALMGGGRSNYTPEQIKAAVHTPDPLEQVLGLAGKGVAKGIGALRSAFDGKDSSSDNLLLPNVPVFPPEAFGGAPSQPSSGAPSQPTQVQPQPSQPRAIPQSFSGGNAPAANLSYKERKLQNELSQSDVDTGAKVNLARYKTQKNDGGQDQMVGLDGTPFRGLTKSSNLAGFASDIPVDQTKFQALKEKTDEDTKLVIRMSQVLDSAIAAAPKNPVEGVGQAISAWAPIAGFTGANKGTQLQSILSEIGGDLVTAYGRSIGQNKGSLSDQDVIRLAKVFFPHAQVKGKGSERFLDIGGIDPTYTQSLMKQNARNLLAASLPSVLKGTVQVGDANSWNELYPYYEKYVLNKNVKVGNDLKGLTDTSKTAPPSIEPKLSPQEALRQFQEGSKNPNFNMSQAEMARQKLRAKLRGGNGIR